MIKNLLIAFAVAFVAGIVFSYAGQDPTLVMGMPVVFGCLAFFGLQMTAGNRKEVQVDKAARESALNAAVPAGQALLYVYREGFMGNRIGWNVSLDGAHLTQLRSPRFIQTTLNPGSHTLAVGVSGFAATQNKGAQETFAAQAGEVIVLALKAKMGALSNTLQIIREPDTATALRKLSKVPMVGAERAAAIRAA